MSKAASKPQREYLLFLRDMLESTEKIIRYVQSKTEEEFLSNDLLVDAVIWNIHIIGEAVRTIPHEVRERYPSVPWKEMNRMRNILSHHYFGLQYNIIWNVASEKAPELRGYLIAIIAAESNEQQLSTSNPHVP